MRRRPDSPAFFVAGEIGVDFVHVRLYYVPTLNEQSTGAAKMTRFNIPKTVAVFINLAVEYKVIDALDVYALAAKYKKNWRGMVDSILETAFVQRQGHLGIDRHANLVMAAEKFWQAECPVAIVAK